MKPLLLLVCLAGWVLPVWAQPVPDLTGTWQGTLEVSGIRLRIVYHFTQQPDGTYGATLDSPDQGATGISVASVTLTERMVNIGMPVIQATYTATLDPSGQTLDGTFQQLGQSLPLVMNRLQEGEAIAAPHRPQEPKPPYPYRVEEVSYPNPQGGHMLAGTLTLPEGPGPFPAVLLISGSGPQDRDETLLGHKPFLILADHLTRQGLAVLRFDDRGTGASTGDFATATSREFATDVAAGLDFLRARPEIDTRRVGLIGHSEGGLVAPMVAIVRPDVAFLVLLAGPGVRGEDILYEQAALILQAEGADDNTIARNRRLQEQLFETLRQRASEQVLAEQLRTLLQQARSEATPEEQQALTDAAIEGQVQQMTSPWMRYFLAYDPRPTLEQVRVPVLALFGEKDLQVPPAQNHAAVAAALKTGANPQSIAETLPGLNHLFQAATTGAPSEYAQIEETLAPVVLERITRWIQALDL
jgi:pimeloyl-ACP methyl ester carboxylesterase